MIANLTSWFAAERGLSDRADGPAYNQLLRAAEVLEPDRVLPDTSTYYMHRSHIIGQAYKISSYSLSSVPMSCIAGWVAEHNDLNDAVIALRRQTARGG